MRNTNWKRDVGLVGVGMLIGGVLLQARPASSQDSAELAERVTALEEALSQTKKTTAAELESVRAAVKNVDASLRPMVEALELAVAELMQVSFTRAGQDLVIAHAGSEIRLTSSGIEIRGKSGVRIEASDIDVVGGTTVDVNAPTTTLLGSTTAELSGSRVRVTAATRVQMDGPITQIGSGNRQVARVGDRVVNGEIVSGSSQILCP